MKLKTTLRFALSFLVLAVGSATAREPNVVVFLVDDLGYMDIGANNPDCFYETPNIDRLSDSGMRFSDGYAANPVCSPTRYTKEAGLEIVDRDYFQTERRRKQLEAFLAKEQSAAMVDESGTGYLGTVGAVALDKEGNLAAGTSTGGLTGKQYGRIGDSPIIAAGTYAKNGVGGISCTGHGEYFIRFAVAHDVVARADYKEISLEEAAEEVIDDVLFEAGGRGGLIGLDPRGEVIMEMNTESMWRGWRNADGEKGTALLAKEAK